MMNREMTRAQRRQGPRRLRERILLGLTLIGWGLAIGCGGYAWWVQRDLAEYYDTTGGVYETYHSQAKKSDKKIVILTVGGVILDGKSLTRQLKRIEQAGDVEAIVLRVESPGGTVYGSDVMFHQLKRVREELDIPIVVSMGSIAASGGYYIAMAVGNNEDAIFAEPASITGSIGVILPHYDVSEFMAEYKVKDDSIRSHQNKQMLSMTRAMTPDQRALIQAQIDATFERFKEVILSGRPKLQERAEELGGERIQLVTDSGRDLATGEVFTATQAVEYGLVDRIGFLEDAIARAAELAGLELEDCQVVRYRQPSPLIELPDLLKASEQTTPWQWLTQPGPSEAWYLESPIAPLRPYPNEYRYWDR